MRRFEPESSVAATTNGAAEEKSPGISSESGGIRSAGQTRISAPARVSLRPSERRDRKSTRLNSSHVEISYAVFCLKKKKINLNEQQTKRTATTPSTPAPWLCR